MHLVLIKIVFCCCKGFKFCSFNMVKAIYIRLSLLFVLSTSQQNAFSVLSIFIFILLSVVFPCLCKRLIGILIAKFLSVQHCMIFVTTQFQLPDERKQNKINGLICGICYNVMVSVKHRHCCLSQTHTLCCLCKRNQANR